MEQEHKVSEDRTVYERIKELLVGYAFLPGDRLHVPELADLLKVSATPVREALNRFCAEDLLTTVPHRGFFVRRLEQSEIADLLEMKYMMLSYAARRGVGDLELDEAELHVLSSLAELGAKNRKTEERLRVYRRCSVSMNAIVMSLARNLSMLKCLENVMDRLHFVSETEATMEGQVESILQESATIALGLISRDERTVVQALERRHQREQSLLPEVMKECVNRLYLRCRPVPQTRARTLRLEALPA